LAEAIKVEWFKHPKSLSEDYQQIGMVFAFITSPKDGYKVCHEWVECRDFMQDAVRAQITNTPCSVYGFTFDINKNPKIDMNKMRVLVSKNSRSEDLDFKSKMKSALNILNHFEKHAGIALSKMEEVNAAGSGKKQIFMFTGSSVWVKSPYLISMYTFLIRLGDKQFKFNNRKELLNSFEELKKLASAHKICDNDAIYLKSTWDRMHDILKNRTALFKKESGVDVAFLAGDPIRSFHHKCGIVSLCQEATLNSGLNKRMRELKGGKQRE